MNDIHNMLHDLENAFKVKNAKERKETYYTKVQNIK